MTDFDFDMLEKEIRDAPVVGLHERAMAEYQLYVDEVKTSLYLAATDLLNDILRASTSEARDLAPRAIGVDGCGEMEFNIDGIRFKVAVYEKAEPDLMAKLSGGATWTPIESLLELAVKLNKNEIARDVPPSPSE